MKNKQRLWKSLKYKDGKIVSGYDDFEWVVGEWRNVPIPKESCVGLNCCPYIADAMGYVEMDILAEVEIDGVTIESDDKVTSEKMRIIRAYHWDKKDSVALSIYVAELVIENYEKQYPNDKRPRDAIEAAKAWIINPCDDTESAAWSAAGSAESAAWSAAESVESAVWSAVWSAESAVWSAARSAESAARSAESAARKETKDKIQEWIIEHITELQSVEL